MGVTNARQYQCDLCGKLELIGGGFNAPLIPKGWLRADERTACGACVEAILRLPVDALAGGIEATCASVLHKNTVESESIRLCDRARALEFAAHMVGQIAGAAWREAEARAHNERDAAHPGRG